MANAKLSSNNSSAVIPTTWTPPGGVSAKTGAELGNFTMPPGVVLSTNGQTLPTPSGATAMDWMTTVFSNTPAHTSNGTVATAPVHTGSTTITHPSAPITLVGTHPGTLTTSGVIHSNGSSSS